MAIINIETATTVCSVAVSEKGQTLIDKVSFDGPSHASLLGSFVEDAVRESKSLGLKIDAVAVSSGPGSYTGLRIGVSMAKGLCFGYNIPLLSIPTLDILACKAIKVVAAQSDASTDSTIPRFHDSHTFCAMLDARRMEVYSSIYDGMFNKIRDTEAVIVAEDTYDFLSEKQVVCFFGNGADKCKNIIKNKNALFIDDLHPLASDMTALSEQAYAERRFEDVAYFEPFYLKDFIATVSKNKVLSEM
jgi:universal bacterial protein YeaZ